MAMKGDRQIIAPCWATNDVFIRGKLVLSKRDDVSVLIVVSLHLWQQRIRIGTAKDPSRVQQG